MQLRRVVFALVLGAVLAVPAQARADWLFTPFIGVNMGGDTEKNTVSYGGSIGWMGAGAFGFEVDFGYAPDFWDSNEVTTVGGNVLDLMGNLMIGIPLGGQHGFGVRPYVVGGVGLLRSRVDDAEGFFDVNENSFGIDAGGGVMIFFSNSVGIRGDFRYFRALHNSSKDELDLSLGSFDFYRATGGITFRF